MSRHDREPRSEGLSLQSLNAEVGRFAIWADPTKRYSPVAQVVSKGYYDREGNHTDRWVLAPTFFNTRSYTFLSYSGILVKPDDPQFTGMTDANGAKRILLDTAGLTGLRQDELQAIMAQEITLKR